MKGFEFGDFEPRTNQPEMDPRIKQQIEDMAADDHDLEVIEEVLGSENVRLATMNNPRLQELIDPTGETDYAA